MASYSKTKIEPEEYAPLTHGPWSGLNRRVYVGEIRYYVNKPITSAPSPYSLRRAECPIPPVGLPTADQSLSAVLVEDGTLNDYKILASNRAYDRLKHDVSEVRANIGLTLVDYEKSITMVATRAKQFLSAVRAVKKLDFKALNKALKLNPNQVPAAARRRSGQRSVDVSNAWLEYTFGWVPLLQDIHDACGVLGNTPPSRVVKGHGGCQFELTMPARDTDYGLTAIKGRVGVTHQMRIRCSSPNLLLLNELGLVNPAYVAWDAVPFSFVVDWFLPVGKFISSWTDWVGLDIVEAFTTQSWECHDTAVSKSIPEYRRESTAWFVQRTLGVPDFQFPTSINYQHGLWKQVTQTALIVQKLVPYLRKHGL